ncbi:hypothetical protein FM119_02030 [Mycetocola reblochoni REB411]|uniref:Uncharacterized protein n=1 Tax=Mycetocola reblochoni REB411 TaxID=1255698 RepID=A0A1R4IJ70_9MICO|nr:hypothetical protein FM119_02030 [Mycetocola reblochoni REB411]
MYSILGGGEGAMRPQGPYGCRTTGRTTRDDHGMNPRDGGGLSPGRP